MAGEPSDSPADTYIGRTILEQFHIEEKIGEGGMGAVYRAHQSTLKRDVAIKILHPELSNNVDAIRRFKREARVNTVLDHPNVVRVFLFGQLPDGSLYIVMEHLRGRSLLDVLHEDGPLPVHRALHIGIQVCEGVGEAHGQGVVHRDIKPENIVLVARGRDRDVAKVLDFGIARVLAGDDQTTATQAGLVFGTARYISPEGAAGEPTDARSDVYSLGVLLFQLLSNTTPFDAPSPVSMLMKHIHEPPPHLRTRAPLVPPAIADVVMRALAKNPDARYDDALTLSQAMQQAAHRSGFGFEAHSGRVAVSVAPQPGGVAPGIPGSAASHPGYEPAPSLRPPAYRPSETLARAPSPFAGEDEPLLVAGLRSGGAVSRTLRALLAIAVGAALVVGLGAFARAMMLRFRAQDAAVDVALLAAQARTALGEGRYAVPEHDSVLALTRAILEVDPQHPDARWMRGEVARRLVREAERKVRSQQLDEARRRYEQALLFAEDPRAIQGALDRLDRPAVATPGVRTRPRQPRRGTPVTLVAIVPSGVEVSAALAPRFIVKRDGRKVGTVSPERSDHAARTFEASFTFRSARRHELIFRLGRGADRIELRTEVAVSRGRTRRPRRTDRDAPPPVTTQGSLGPLPDKAGSTQTAPNRAAPARPGASSAAPTPSPATPGTAPPAAAPSPGQPSAPAEPAPEALLPPPSLPAIDFDAPPPPAPWHSE